MLAAPHTSNWDFPYTIAAFDILNIAVRYTVKKEFDFFPFSGILNSLGAIWVDRSPKKEGEERRSMVEVMTELFDRKEPLVVLVTPEGTRSKRTKWKTGFYHVALNANVPIALGYVDFKTKIAGVGKVIYPSGDIEKDMREIMAFYNTINGKIPANYSPDLRYSGTEKKEVGGEM